jgi:hypothetical protein
VRRLKRAWFGLAWIDALLFGMAAVLVAVGAVLLRLSPAWWGYYLSVLDIRIWPPWKCIAVVVVLLETPLVIRFWPNKRPR